MNDNIGHTLKKEQMITALEKSLGVVSSASKACGVSRDAHYRWMKEDPTYKQKVEDIENISIDFVESQLFKQIQEGNTVATIFFLKTRGKKRGYVERQEIEFPGTSEIVIRRASDRVTDK